MLPSALLLPALVAAGDERAQIRFLEFFAITIRNPNTRRAYVRAIGEFLGCSAVRGVASLAAVQPLRVAGYVEELGRVRSVPTVKLRPAAVRHLFDWLVTGQVVPVNPVASIRGPAHSVCRGRTPVIDAREARALIDAIDVSTPIGLRDRALIGLMVYSFARVGAALAMRVEDVFVQNRRLWVRRHEKGVKRHNMPCHHNLEEYLTADLDGCELPDDCKGPLFRTLGRGTRQLTTTPLPQTKAFQLGRHRVTAVDFATAIGNHSFRATGITAYLKSGGTLEKAAVMANHASTRTTQLYDRRDEPRRSQARAHLSSHNA